MTKDLPISNSARPCLVDDDVSHWFEGTALTLDDEGVYFETEQQRFYVHDQVMIIAIKRGTADSRQYLSRKPHEIVREIKGGSSSEGILFFGQEEKNVAANKRGRNVVHWQRELDTIRL